MKAYPKKLPIGKVSNYTLTVDSGWLGAESITGFTVSVPSGGATVATLTSSANVLQAYFTGVTAGRHEVEWEWTTATRSDCYKALLTVEEC